MFYDETVSTANFLYIINKFVMARPTNIFILHDIILIEKLLKNVTLLMCFIQLKNHELLFRAFVRYGSHFLLRRMFKT